MFMASPPQGAIKPPTLSPLVSAELELQVHVQPSDVQVRVIDNAHLEILVC